MIGSLRGRLLDRGTDEVVVEVGGIGYRVVVSPTTVVALGELGQEVLVWTHHHVREDAESLYGFATADTRRCFTALLGAHGVGPALAMAILAVHGPSELARARLLIELKSRLDLPFDVDIAAITSGGAGAALASPRADVREALSELGFGPEDIRSVLADLPDAPTEDLLREALKRLALSPSGSLSGRHVR
jgi:Holliday junction DNA helicase RuvA